ncbi:hypothetical protein SFRURICE_001469 [Spodoptera frugiperda]|nr:hypothetical protein SFRURICE_001469 [Spodoptera frugiperda]
MLKEYTARKIGYKIVPRLFARPTHKRTNDEHGGWTTGAKNDRSDSNEHDDYVCMELVGNLDSLLEDLRRWSGCTGTSLSAQGSC